MSKIEPRETHRIAKLLARAGVASRREIERMIEDGRVAINGVPISTPATLLDTLKGVTVDGVAVQAPEATRLYIFHKPTGLITTAFDPKGRPTIYDRLPKDLPRVMPVGRLDLNTEGLLLMTTDGEFKRQLELPATGVERTYRARTYGQISQAQLEELIEGVEIEGVRYGPIDANLERRTGANVWIELTLKEGKNREVRRVLEYLGLEVSRLIRTRYGPFILGDLPPGEVGEVRQNDLVAFRKTLKLPAGQRADDGGTVAASPIRKRAALPAPVSTKSAVEPERRARVARPQAPRKAEVREEIDTRPQRPDLRPGQRPAAHGARDMAPIAVQAGRSGRQRVDGAAVQNRPLRNAPPANPRGPRTATGDPARPPRPPRDGATGVTRPPRPQRDTAGGPARPPWAARDATSGPARPLRPARDGGTGPVRPARDGATGVARPPRPPRETTGGPARAQWAPQDAASGQARPSRPARDGGTGPARPPRDATARPSPQYTAVHADAPPRDDTPRPPKPKKGAGWARAKPKAKPGAKPRKRP